MLDGSINSEGCRVRKLLAENLRFVYDMGGRLIAEFDGASGGWKKEYIYGADAIVASIEPTTGTRYMTSDHLGTPRVVTSSAGVVISRHDYKPFGEELFVGSGGRTAAQFYSVTDGLRQKFTSYERDGETGLDFAQARYYSATIGRFTSPDEFTERPTELFAEVAAHNPTFYAEPAEPQSLNKYHYCLNDPLRYLDPNGHQTTAADKVKEGVENVVVGGAKAVGNFFIGINNFSASFTGGQMAEPYRAENFTQAATYRKEWFISQESYLLLLITYNCKVENKEIEIDNLRLQNLYSLLPFIRLAALGFVCQQCANSAEQGNV